MISLGYISPGTVATRFHESVVNLMRSDHRVNQVISLISGPRIATARCDVVREFLKSGNDWLFMVDTDMTFSPDVVEKFIQNSNPKIRPVIGGLCFGGGRVGFPFPTLYTLVDPSTNQGKLTKVVTDYPKDALCKVDATGAAALFMHRSILLDMEKNYGEMPDGHPNPHPWFAETVQLGHEYGEDWTFCMRLRKMKVPLYVHTGIKFGHVKSHNYDESFFERMRNG